MLINLSDNIHSRLRSDSTKIGYLKKNTPWRVPTGANIINR